MNPAHLRWQSPSENTLNSDHHNRRIEECPQGHPYDEANTRIRANGRRACRACERERAKRNRQRT